ncbi:hypothetical protein [Pseudomonas segetis]|uniref:Uncharacterized protein n=1 Tax=Pseudomonas segetis TaxID=298908 RepID=A0A239C8S4_9PSED|nr:hypothetical protein [Pseudomonas segetis]SNS16646.1 hypothetical protein SAMN05216255_1575 [Pseudomonas segetis]
MHTNFYECEHSHDVLTRHERDLNSSIKNLLDPRVQEQWDAGDHERACKTIANLRAQIKWVEGRRSSLINGMLAA